MTRILFLFLLLIQWVSVQARTELIRVDFETNTIGPYTLSNLEGNWQSVPWSQLENMAFITTDPSEHHGKVLTIHYPKGSVGPSEGGAQFEVSLPSAREYWLQYDLKMKSDFDFRLGGKLPGLASGGTKYTGGNRPTEGQGWSARYMWRKGGSVVLYLYSIDMHGKWGDDHKLDFAPLETGRWYTVRQHVRVNDPQQKNGLVETWIDDEKVQHLDGLRLRLAPLGLIDTFYFSTFFGGNTSEWGPRVDGITYFDNFRIWRE